VRAASQGKEHGPPVSAMLAGPRYRERVYLMTGNNHQMGSLARGRVLRTVVWVSILGIAASYVLSAIIRIIRGERALRAFLPDPVLIGVWAGIVLLCFTVVLFARRRERGGRAAGSG
jgi:hypothetical protein